MANIVLKTTEIKDAIMVPNESIIAEMGKTIAYLYTNGKAKRVELTKGVRTSSEIPILEGLVPGDTLIITGVMQLRDGLPVVIDNIVGEEPIAEQ
jgi:membrane fusion protein (multidrug efflux system)